MLVNNVNKSSVAVFPPRSCSKCLAIKTGPAFVILMIYCLFSTLLAHADGLFDFQMKLANKGNAEAQFKVGEMYETGFGVKQDMKQAEEWIRKAAGKGHETAGFKLLYWDVEKNGLNAGNKAKVDELNKKANAGNAQAQYYVGKMYAHGVGVKKNPDTAVDWLSKATLVGVLAAESELARVKEDQKKQAAYAKRREQEKQAELKQQREKQLELERQRQAKVRANQAAARQKAAKVSAAQKAAEEAAARKAAEEAAARKAAQQRQRHAQQQAKLKQQQKKAQKQRKQQFEADPCSGKSAKFLSTCR